MALGDRLKVFSDILKLGRFFFTETLTYDPDAVKKRLRKEGVPAMLAELDQVLAEVEPFDLATLEKAVHDYAEQSGRKMGDVVNPLRVAVTGQGVGPGLYDCLVILGPRDVPGPDRAGRWRCSRQTIDLREYPTSPGRFSRRLRLTDEPSEDRAACAFSSPDRSPSTTSWSSPGRFRDHILPDKMHVLSVSFLVDSLTRLRGGTGANISFNLASWASGPSWSGPWAKTSPSIAHWLEGHGVDCRRVKVDRRRPHGLVLHQHRPAGQPDHGVLSRRHGAGGVDLDHRGRGHAERPGRDRPQRPGGDESLCGRVHRRRGFPISTTRRCSSPGWSGPTWRRAAGGAGSWPATTTNSG